MVESARQKLKHQWPFLQSVCNGGWFKPLLFGQSVCDEELNGSEKDSNWPLISTSHRSNFEAKVTRFLEESGPFPELINSRPIYNQNEHIKKENKAPPLRASERAQLAEKRHFRAVPSGELC